MSLNSSIKRCLMLAKQNILNTLIIPLFFLIKIFAKLFSKYHIA